MKAINIREMLEMTVTAFGGSCVAQVTHSACKRGESARRGTDGHMSSRIARPCFLPAIQLIAVGADRNVLA